MSSTLSLPLEGVLEAERQWVTNDMQIIKRRYLNYYELTKIKLYKCIFKKTLILILPKYK